VLKNLVKLDADIENLRGLAGDAGSRNETQRLAAYRGFAVQLDGIGRRRLGLPAPKVIPPTSTPTEPADNGATPVEPAKPADKPTEHLKPSHKRAGQLYDWAMEHIEGADTMTYPGLFKALRDDSRCGGEGLPNNAAAFARYCRGAGIRRNTPRRAKGATRNIRRVSAL
jgi:hypothetical protein